MTKDLTAQTITNFRYCPDIDGFIKGEQISFNHKRFDFFANGELSEYITAENAFSKLLVTKYNSSLGFFGECEFTSRMVSKTAKVNGTTIEFDDEVL